MHFATDIIRFPRREYIYIVTGKSENEKGQYGNKIRKRKLRVERNEKDLRRPYRFGHYLMEIRSLEEDSGR